ncbi:50S ribosomal protein L18 [Paracrocinitomix mangrovi]|uniref:50S ribosomal protein L18 n=1 Tax=Paracrocinitomix mangrovi TaxID=2862509 RepID=UPI001C8EE5DA|nr:50S ribosomal protein L18 [Paracrocinitomix mangrovi]UKN03167.1 50S ribosomal protein L18 [Paracrocinitomix mangrovi]
MASRKVEQRAKIKRRVRKNIFGTAERPRLSVFRSNKAIYAQIINDVDGKTVASASSVGLKAAEGKSKSEAAALVGKELAAKASKAGVEQVVFDRNGYQYHGRVKSLADGAREGGLNF